MKVKKGEDKVISVRLPLKIHKKLQEIADIETRSLNQQILHYVKIGLRENSRYAIEEEKGGQQITSEKQISPPRSSE